jgi:hypothetical protein
MTSSLLGIDTQTGQRVEIPKTSRLQGLYIVGIQGTGKSGLIENLIIDDIKQGTGVAVLDPHGDLINAVLARMDRRENDVILLDIGDEDYPFGLNLFECSNPKSTKVVQIVVDQVMHVFEKLFDVSRQTPRMSQYLRNCTYTLIANPGSTMAEIPLLLEDGQCRKRLVENVTNPQVRLFWHQYERMRPQEQYEEARSTLNKLDEFLQGLSLNIIAQSKSTMSFRDVMDEGKILLVKLDAKLASVTSLIGSVIIAQCLNAAYSRPANKRRQFHLYADEFQRFATEDFATLLEEARKFGLGITMAHQNRGQLELNDKQAGANLKQRTLSVGNLIVFRVPTDAVELAGKFDTTPLRTKRALKQRTKPIFKEWDETVWIEDGEAQFNEAEAQYIAQYEAHHAELTRRLAEAEEQEGEALDRLKAAIEAEVILSVAATGYDLGDIPSRAYSGSPYSEYQYMPLHPAWYCYNNSSGLVTVRSYWTQPDLKLMGDKVGYDRYLGKGWTDEKVENTIGGLLEVKSRTLADSYEYEYGDMYAWWRGERELRKKRIDFTYDELEERYTLSETTLTGIQADLQERMAKASAEARRILSDVYDELSEIIKPLLRQGVWFKPHLMPFMPHTRFNTGSWPNGLGPPRYPSIFQRGRKFEESLLEWPLLAKYPQPKIGEKRTVKGWTRHGEWIVREFPRVLDWLDKRQQALKELCVKRRDELHVCQEPVSRIKQQIEELEAKDQQMRPKIKAQYQKIEHHKEYLGEQSEVMERTRSSYSISTTGSSSTSYSTNEVQWYDLTDELDQTHAQRRDEIANELTQLPFYTAQVKIATETGIKEYTIRTLDPKKQAETPLYGQALQKRLAYIKEQNIQNGYLRERTEVEVEIIQRQEQYSQPLEGEPPISRRPPR